MKNLVALQNPIGIVYDILSCVEASYMYDAYVLRLSPRGHLLGKTVYKTVTILPNGQVYFGKGWTGIYEGI